MPIANETQPIRKVVATSTISSKGQITLPVEVRRRLGVNLGDRVEFAVENGLTVVRPVRAEGNPFEKYIGMAPFDDPKQTSVRFWREMRGHDPEDGDDF